MTARVIILQETLPHYRVALLEQVGDRAAERGIAVEVVHGHAPGERGRRLSTGALQDAVTIHNRYLRAPGSNGTVVWQPALRRCLSADLVVVEQANRLLINYVLLLAQRLRGLKVAFWGHGRNLQASPTSLAERTKGRMARLPSWWFAYTAGVAEHLGSLGFPQDRVTIVGNTIDVIGLRRAVDQHRPRCGTAPLRCAYVGGFYNHKRLDLLFEASDLIADRLPGFELLIAGSGEQRSEVERFVRDRSWASYLGPVEGDDRARLLASVRLLLIPGLVGLVVLDSFAAGVPLVSTADALHSPEIEYIDEGVNGVLLPSADATTYARKVIELLENEPALERLRRGAYRSAEEHGIAQAAERFVGGIESALEMAGTA